MLTNLYNLEQMARDIPEDRLREAYREQQRADALNKLMPARKPETQETRLPRPVAVQRRSAARLLQMLRG
ncbi:MAG: hypothetical protein ABIO92_00480 [Chloroflexia bacterium]